MWTPALEYEEVLRTGDENAAGAGFRTFDEQGHVLALRSDMTIPIARVVATRYAEQPGPLRLCYFAHAYRAVERGTGQQREFLQGGMELIGVDGAAGEAEVIALTLSALDEVGLARHRIGLGDGALYRALLRALEVPEGPLLERLCAAGPRGAGAHGGRARARQGCARPAGAPAGAARWAGDPRGADRARSTGFARCTRSWRHGGWRTA